MGVKMEVKKVKCDVLCVGGGIAGLMAAIEATENGAGKVIVAEKANTKRSGSAGNGNDHFHCYIPDVHGDYEAFAEDLIYGQMAGRISSVGREAADYWFQNSYKVIKLWESWGIPMKYEGEYHFAGHSFPGQVLNHLKYAGQNQKYVLTKQALAHGVEIMNRVMIVDVLVNEQNVVCGAVGISTREDVIIQFEAKAVILGTGVATRMYPSKTLHNFNRQYPGTNCGDGRAMAYRAGAKLMDIEMTSYHAGPKYFVRSGQATWVGVLRERDGTPVGPFIDKPNRIYSDMTTEVNKGIFDEYLKSGRGPIYMDGRGMSDEDWEYMKYWLKHEGNEILLQHLEEEGIDFRKHPIEFMTYERGSRGGIPYNVRGETSLKGLYAAGDENFGGISCAAVFGMSAGENATKYAQTAQIELDSKAAAAKVKELKAFVEEMRARKNAPKWQEANAASQQIMVDYTDDIRSGPGLESGLENIRRLRKRVRERLMAENAHELMRSLETLNLIDLGELVIVGALERKETRGTHRRPDYPLINPMKVHLYISKGEDGEPVTEWKE